MPALEVFHTTWGGEESLIKQLEDLEPEFPFWARPLWHAICKALKPFIVSVHRERTIRQIKEQSKTVGDQMAATERYHQVQRAVAKAQAEHPHAKVSVHHVQSHSIDAVLVEHPPDPNDAAQVALGFGALEIKSSFETE